MVKRKSYLERGDFPPIISGFEEEDID